MDRSGRPSGGGWHAGFLAMTLLWLPAALVVPVFLVALAMASGPDATASPLVARRIAAGTLLGTVLAPLAVVAPLADRMDQAVPCQQVSGLSPTSSKG